MVQYTGRSGSHDFHACYFLLANHANVMRKLDKKLLIRVHVSCKDFRMIFTWNSYNFYAYFLRMFFMQLYICVKFIIILCEFHLKIDMHIKSKWQIKKFTFNFIYQLFFNQSVGLINPTYLSLCIINSHLHIF